MNNTSRLTNEWLERKALEFLKNSMLTRKSSIKDPEATFGFIAGKVSQAQFLWSMRKVLGLAGRLDVKRDYALRHRGAAELDRAASPAEWLAAIWNTPGRKQAVCKLIDALTASLPPLPKKKEETQVRWDELIKFLKLSSFEESVLLVFRCGDYFRWIDFPVTSELDNPGIEKLSIAADYLNCSAIEIRRALKQSEKLIRYNCIAPYLDYNANIEEYLLGLTDISIFSAGFKPVTGETLPMDYYNESLMRHGKVIKALLKSGEPVHILLYGEPGTGKTSFAMSLMKEAGKTGYGIPHTTQIKGFRDHLLRQTEPNSTTYRYNAIELCDGHIDHQHSVILVDEADHMLRSNEFSSLFGSSNSGDKGRINNLLDSIQTSSIWICNIDANELDESCRRRFDYAIKFDPMDKEQRLAVWKNNLEKMQMEERFTTEQLENFAASFSVNAGGITLALENLKRIDPEQGEAEEMLKSLLERHCELMSVKVHRATAPVPTPAKDYSLEGLNIKGDISLEHLTQAVRKFRDCKADTPDRPRMNLLLSGPPGTGKTEFVKYLGAELNLPVTCLMGSDLLDKYVGGTEQNIRRAFERAEAERSILFLDEIDGLVQNRSLARNNWEVTIVSELLHRMENFKGILIGATNFKQNLDPAIMRRFTFKVTFDYLDNAGKKLFFERMFNTKLNFAEERRLNAIDRLTPGDFRTVRQGLYYLDAESNDLRLSALEEESASQLTFPQQTSERHRIGFGGAA